MKVIHWIFAAGHASGETLVIAAFTALIASLTWRSQKRTERSQDRVEELQSTTKDIIHDMLVIQRNMNHRELKYQHDRAKLAVTQLKMMTNACCNLFHGRTLELPGSIFGWQDEVAYLPSCRLRERVEKVFSHIVAGGGLGALEQELNDLRSDFPKLETDANRIIKEMLSL